jgi:hypothetical protein
MTAKISKISLIVSVVLLVFIPAVATISGQYWPYYVFASVLAMVPIIVGPSYYRLIGAGALLVSVVLIVHDVAAGRHFRAQHPEIQWTR